MESNATTQNQAENENPKPQEGNWLKDLGDQSWQAELVISGLILTVLFQLPDFFITWVTSSIIQSGETEYSFLNLASLFFLIGIDSLIIFFGVHLLFRGIWIALLGLNSVYPNGIDVTSKNGLGEKHWQKAREKYPNLTEYTTKLDADCSLFFSLATVTIIILSSISIIILVFYQIFRFLVSIFPSMVNYTLYIGLGLYLLFLTVSYLIQYLAKKYPDNARIQRISSGYGSAMGTLFSLYIFEKPIGYINSIYTSNSKSTNMRYFFMIVSMFMGFFGARQLGTREVFQDFEVARYFVFNNKPHQILAANYENLASKEAEIYTPIIQSDVVSDNYLKVFIPTVAREKEHMTFKEYGLVERFKMTELQRIARDQENLEVYKQFNRIFVNDVAYPNLEYQFFYHPQAQEKGLLVYVPTDSLPKGRNILEIRKNYFSKDSVQKIVKIPFFFDK